MTRLRIQPRDVTLAVGVFRHGFLLRDHAWKLYFPECALRRATRRLHSLCAQKVLVAHPLPLGAFAFGVEGFLPHVGQYAYRVGEAGIPLVAQALEIDNDTVRRRLRRSPTYLGHAVAVSALHVALHHFQEAQGYQVEQFLTEGEARHVYEWREAPTSPWKRAEVRPDALAWLARAGETTPWLIEADMASQSKAAVAIKLSGYALYLKTQTHRGRFGDAPFRLLLVTTSEARRDTLAALVKGSDLASLPGVLPGIALTTFSDFFSQGVFGPIWHIPARGQERNRHVVP